MATDNLFQIDEKILRLKKKKENLQTQQALFFTKEAQKIFQENFSPEIALVVLENCWRTASDKQRKEWQVQAPHFRFSLQRNRQKNQPSQPESLEN